MPAFAGMTLIENIGLLNIMKNTILAASHVLLIRNEDEILLQRRFNTGYKDGEYGLPAGHIEHSETATACAVREMREEIGVVIDAQDLSLLHTMYRIKQKVDHDYVCFFFRAARWHGAPEIKEPEKCDDLRWFKLDSLPANTIDYIRFALNEISRGNLYSEWDGRQEAA
jgi:mutator protein MutT